MRKEPSGKQCEECGQQSSNKEFDHVITALERELSGKIAQHYTHEISRRGGPGKG